MSQQIKISNTAQGIGNITDVAEKKRTAAKHLTPKESVTPKIVNPMRSRAGRNAGIKGIKGLKPTSAGTGTAKPQTVEESYMIYLSLLTEEKGRPL